MSIITCITISHNDENALRRTIESVLTQTFADFEYLIVDCASTDGTQALIEEYARQDRRIVAVYSDISNILQHLSLRAKDASGKWLTVLNAGEAYYPEFFQRALDFINAHKINAVDVDPQSVLEQTGEAMNAECGIPHDLLIKAFLKDSAAASLDKSFEPLLSKSPFTADLTARDAIFMSDAVSSILEGKYQKALDEIIAMIECEIPDDCAQAYLTLGQNLSAATENADAYVFFKKVWTSYLLDNSRHDEANIELKELSELLPDDEDVSELWARSISDDEGKAMLRPYVDALILLKMGRAYDGFSMLTQMYSEKDSAQQESIMSILIDEFHAPHHETLCGNYEKNRSTLLEYPYWFGRKAPVFDELNMLVFPIDGDRCFIFNTKANEFSEIEINSEKETKYFFKDLSKPIFVENETNEYNFRFLVDNVRPSEDVAMDNHIYLYYENPELLYCVMQIIDFCELLETKKIVYLLGEENRASYPIDFKARFDVDYSLMPKQEIRIGDIKRFVFQWSIHGLSGHSFLIEIMDYHPNLITNPDGALEHYRELYEFAKFQNPDILIDNFFDLPEDNIFRKEISRFICLAEKFEGEQKQAELGRYLNILKRTIRDVSLTPVSGWLKALLFAFAMYKGREFDDRIFPAFYYYPHTPRDFHPAIRAFYTAVCDDWRYCYVLSSIRDPISVASSMVGLIVKEKAEDCPSSWFINAHVFGWHTHFRDKNDTIYKKGVMIRFEDFKLNFPAMLPSIISFLNIPYSHSLESTTQNGVVCKEIASLRENYKDGFDTSPVYSHIRNHNYLSEYDKYRIEMIVSEYYSHFGYARKFYDGKVYTPAEVEKMMNEPWQCDKLEIEKGLFTKEHIQAIRKRTADYWRKSLENPIPTGKDIVPMRILQPVPELLENELYK